MVDLARLGRRIGYTFINEPLILEALSHRSVSKTNYERLEFLGDSLLNFVVAEALFDAFPELDEGSLSRLRASLVRGTTLADIAREFELGEFLQMGVGELRSGGFDRDSILADLVESILGAVYKESGFEVARELVLRLMGERLTNMPSAAELKDPKTQLQEILQGLGLERPVYTVVEQSGQSHNPEFTVSCHIASHNKKFVAKAASRRKAEQAAASLVLAESATLFSNAKQTPPR